MFLHGVRTAVGGAHLRPEIQQLVMDYTGFDATETWRYILGARSEGWGKTTVRNECRCDCVRSWDEDTMVSYFDYSIMKRTYGCGSCRFTYCSIGKSEYQICRIEQQCCFCDYAICQHAVYRPANHGNHGSHGSPGEEMVKLSEAGAEYSYNTHKTYVCQNCRYVIREQSLTRRMLKVPC